jgi:DNA replicative helicase MCM subunit Mcm2 (Cdc46/Mcm family)
MISKINIKTKITGIVNSATFCLLFISVSAHICKTQSGNNVIDAESSKESLRVAEVERENESCEENNSRF